ncbi:hypothetical protein GWR56_13670 [Mucilaginibacter sp. 14171R-50]|uniref:hypothetical protein n=1 Tax=Mucilaginibacter sp. 14171R-50 TaxID=2703789 RepID=UPI00138C0E3C|nr:hypothetical protein [Mucilaginibacter sp. 14171R-50]QHS56537.1 hypothetical protein GWR56_13670 [Mucilaginibacter sp. 14171R-50]
MFTKFVNRTKEFEFLEIRGQDVGVGTNTVMLCGESGVGKSELARNFLDRKAELYPTIKVPIQQAEKDSYSAGYYLTKLAKEMHDHARKDKRIYSLEDFLRKSASASVLVKKIGTNFKTDLSAFVPFSNTAKSVWDLVFASGDFDASAFFQSTHSDILLTIYEYVLHECSRHSMIVNIENVQNIDYRSLELLTSIIRSSNNCLYLLEFTEDSATGYHFSELVSILQENNITVDFLPVAPLSLEDVKRLIDEQPNLTWEVLKNSYVNWNGNMRLIVDVLAKLRYGLPVKGVKVVDILSATIEHIDVLKNAELFLLTIIAVHHEPVEINLLKRLTTFKEALAYVLDVDSILSALENRYLIKKSAGTVMLAHDSIAVALHKLSRSGLFSIIGQRFWLNTYEQLLDERDIFLSRGWLLMKVLYFSSLLTLDAKVFGLLDLINQEALKSRDPEKMIGYVADVRLNLFQKDTIKHHDLLLRLDHWLIEIWLKLGHSQKSWEILLQLNDNAKVFRLLKAMLMEQIGKHGDAIGFCESELSTAITGSNYELALRLVKLVTNYDIGNKSLSSAEFFDLYRNDSYVNLFEYGFLLRNAELVFNYVDGLPYYLESISHFERFGAKRQAAFSRITYGVHLGLTGKYRQAEEQFLQAEDELGDEITEKHTLWNNLAVLELSRGITNGNAEELLRQALVTASGDFDRFTIAMNYLILMDFKNQDSDAEMAISTMLKILEQPSFANKEILRYAFFDLHKYYEKTGNAVLAGHWRKRIDELGMEETPIWRFWLYGVHIPENDEEYFLSLQDRAISFLCNWNMEYDSSLMRYE